MRMNPRRWFWLFNLLAVICIIVAVHRPGVVRGSRNIAGQSVRWVLSPVAWTFTRIQMAFNSVLHPVVATDPKYARMKEHYQNETTMLMARVQTLEHLLRESRLIHQGFPGISSQQLRAANVEGFASDSDDACILDQGWHDDQRIRRGAVVMAELSVVGRISSAGAATSVVRLLSDRQMRVTAAIVRPTPDGQITITNLCLVHGIGRGRMRCLLDQVLGAMAPRIGDLVLLNDNEWPPEVSGAVIGVVASVTESRKGNLRWDLHILPRVNMAQTRHAVIVLTR